MGRGMVGSILGVALAFAGCGGDGASCSEQGQILGEQILTQRDKDVAAGYLPAGAHPCALTAQDIDQVRLYQPQRVAQYADACSKYAAHGCDPTKLF